MTDKINVAMIGYGHWGKILEKNFSNDIRFNLSGIYDPTLVNHPQEVGCVNKNILNNKEINLVVIASPASTHFKYIYDALLSGKKIIVTKPACLTLQEVQYLDRLENSKDVIVDNTYIYSAHLDCIIDLIAKNLIGNILHIESTRTGFGIYKNDVDIFLDLVIHDLAIAEYMLGVPKACNQISFGVIGPQKDNSYVRLIYEHGINFTIRSSWLHPKKNREIIFIGDLGMLIWDDATSIITHYPKVVHQSDESSTFGRMPYIYKDGEGCRINFRSEKTPIQNLIDDAYLMCMNNNIPKSGLTRNINIFKILSMLESSNG
jgi:predicted dehydrogenase